MNKRKTGYLMAALVFSLSIFMSVGCTKNTTPGSDSQTSGTGGSEDAFLLDFSNIEVTIELGQKYNLPNVVSDSQGIDYPVDYSAVDENGNNVALDKMSFQGNKVGKFVITATVTFNNKEVSRTITINVVDRTNPTVTIKAKRGYVGKTYTPRVTVEDNDQNCNLQIDVFSLDGETETKINTDNGVFTPTIAGDYRIKATATDASQNVGTASADFEVLTKREYADGDIINFDEEEDMECVSHGNKIADRYAFSYLEEYEGKTGVMKLASIDDCTVIQIEQTAFPKSHYAEYDSVVVRAYFKSGKAVHHFDMQEQSNSYGDVKANPIAYDSWFDYKFTIDVFNSNDTPWFMIYTDGLYGVTGEIYIDSIWAEKTFKVEIGNAPDGEVNTEYVLPNVTVTNSVGEYALEVKVFYLDGGSETEVTVTNNRFTPTSFGQYKMKVLATDSVGHTATAETTFYVEPQDFIRDDEVIDFNEQSDIKRISCGNKIPERYDFSIIDSFEGESGVLKLVSIDDCTVIQIEQTAHEKSYYNSFDYLVVRAYFKSGKAVHHFDIQELSNSYGDVKTDKMHYDEWFDYRFEIKTFNDYAKPFFMIYTDGLYGFEGEIYIADIRVDKPLKVNIASAPDGVVGQEYTLPAISVLNNVGEYTTNITLKHGNDSVAISNNKFTPTEEGNYVMKVDVEDSAHNIASAQTTIYVLAAADPARDDEVIDFNEPSDLSAVSIGPRPVERYRNFEILDSYDGETGVLKFETCEDVIRIQIESMAHEMTHYTSGSYTKVVFRCWLSHKGANDLHHVYAFPEGWYNSYYFNGGGAGNIIYEQWYDYSFPLDALRIGDSSQGGKPSLGIYTDTYGTWANMYIADIRVE